MASVETMGEEEIRVAEHGPDAVRISIDHPYFGRIATVRIDAAQAADLAAALARGDREVA
jgi:hypothetical protein